MERMAVPDSRPYMGWGIWFRLYSERREFAKTQTLRNKEKTNSWKYKQINREKKMDKQDGNFNIINYLRRNSYLVRLSRFMKYSCIDSSS